MHTVLIICTDPRVTIVKEQIQPLVIAKISIIPGFDAGLASIFSKMPEIVFIQQKMAGIQAELVIRHVKALLQANSPVFIPLGGCPDTDRGYPVFDTIIDMSLPDGQLVEAFKAQIRKVSAIRWKEMAPRLLTEESGGIEEQKSLTGWSRADIFLGAADRPPAEETLVVPHYAGAIPVRSSSVMAMGEYSVTTRTALPDEPGTDNVLAQINMSRPATRHDWRTADYRKDIPFTEVPVVAPTSISPVSVANHGSCAPVDRVWVTRIFHK